MAKFVRIEIPGNLAFKLSEMLIDHAERNCCQSNVQSALFTAHKLWTIWYQGKTRPDHSPGLLVMCEEWVLLCFKVLVNKLKEDPASEDLKRLMECFTSGRIIGES